MKKFIKYFSILFICTCLSQVLFYYILDDLISRIILPVTIVSLSLRILLAFGLFVFLCYAIDKNINNVFVDILALLYLCVVLALSTIRGYSSYGVNINPLIILDDFKRYFTHTLLILICNLLIYMPLGVYLRRRLKISDWKLFLVFLIYIFSLEIIQTAIHVGICDINDIITNAFGFYVGVALFNIKKCIWDEKKRFLG